MKWFFLLFSFSILAGDIPLGDIVINIPNNPGYQQIKNQTRQFSVMESSTPATNRLLYLSAPNELAKKSNQNEVVDLNNYHVIQSYRQAEFMDISTEMFNANKESMLEGIKTALNSTTVSDLEKEMNKNFEEQQGITAKVKLGKPQLLGEPTVSDSAFRFILLSELKLENETVKMTCMATTTVIKNRMVYLYSYCVYKDKNTLAHLKSIHETFVQGILSKN